MYTDVFLRTIEGIVYQSDQKYLRGINKSLNKRVEGKYDIFQLVTHHVDVGEGGTYFPASRSKLFDYRVQKGEEITVLSALDHSAETIERMMRQNPKSRSVYHLFAIRTGRKNDPYGIEIQTLNTNRTYDTHMCMRMGKMKLGVTPENTSVVIIYSTGDVSTVHGHRYPEFIESGIDNMWRMGVKPLFWYVDRTSEKYHPYLFLAGSDVMYRHFLGIK